MNWNEALWRTLNEARRLSVESPNEEVAFNGHVCAFLDLGYITMQALAIRRLVDKRSDTESLTNLLHSIRKNAHLISREIYVCNDGIPYDPTPAHEEAARRAAEQAVDGVFFEYLDFGGPNDWVTSRNLHDRFDKLSGVSPSRRTRNDRIKDHVFDVLGSKLRICNTIKAFADKFIAHAANVESLNGIRPKNVGIHLRRILVCQRTVCQVANFIDGALLWNSTSTLFPTPQGDCLQDLEKRLVTQENKEKLYEYWNKHTEEIEQWVEAKWTAPFSP